MRWLNYLRPNLKHGRLNAEEEKIILQLHKQWGNKYGYVGFFSGLYLDLGFVKENEKQREKWMEINLLNYLSFSLHPIYKSLIIQDAKHNLST